MYISYIYLYIYIYCVRICICSYYNNWLYSIYVTLQSAYVTITHNIRHTAHCSTAIANVSSSTTHTAHNARQQQQTTRRPTPRPRHTSRVSRRVSHHAQHSTHRPMTDHLCTAAHPRKRSSNTATLKNASMREHAPAG